MSRDDQKLPVSCDHCHGFENGAGGVCKWGAGEQNSWLVKHHVEGEAECHHQEGSQDDQLPEGVEDVNKHQYIDPCNEN